MIAPQSKPAKRGERRMPRRKAFGKATALAVFGVVICIGLSCLLMRSADRGQHAIEETRSPRPADELALDAKTAAIRTVIRSETAPKSTSAANPAKETWLGQEVVRHDYTTNNTLVVETIYTSDGKKHKYYHDEREKALPSGADQILAMMTANNPYGAPPLPRVANFENEFGDALKTPIEITDSDSDAVKELKERVIAARKEMLELMAEGFRAEDVIREWEKAQEDNASVRLDAVRDVKALLAEGDAEGARALCDEYNKILERAGIMKIELPDAGKRGPEE